MATVTQETSNVASLLRLAARAVARQIGTNPTSHKAMLTAVRSWRLCLVVVAYTGRDAGTDVLAMLSHPCMYV